MNECLLVQKERGKERERGRREHDLSQVQKDTSNKTKMWLIVLVQGILWLFGYQRT